MRLLLLCLVTTSVGVAAVPSGFGHLPIYFKPEANATFQAQGLRYSLSLQPQKTIIQMGNRSRHAQLSIDYLNSNPAAHLEPRDHLSTRAAEFIGNDPARWRRNIPTYGKVAAHNLYPGIDLLYYGNNSGLEYDFMVSPGADPHRIRMHIEGADKISLNASGDLILHTAAGDILQHRPVVFQSIQGQRREIGGNFVLDQRGDVGFHLARYDRRQPLTIDPGIAFSTFVGNYNEEDGLAVAVDNSGNVYMGGYTTSSNFGDQDLLILSLNPTGTAANYIVQASGSFGFGGSGDDVVNGIAVDGYGSLVAVGSTGSPDFPTTKGAFNATGAGGNYDAFILRLDPTGQTLIYSTYFGGTGDDELWSVALDPLGNTYVVGDTTSTDLPVTSGAYQAKNAGGADGFIAKFDANGNQIWTSYFGGSSDEYAYSIAVDPTGNTYVTGFTDSSNFPTVNAYQSKYNGGNEAFVLKMNPTGTQVVYSTFLGGGGDDQGSGIALDAAQNAYIVGTTASTNFPVTSGAYKTAYQGGNSDIFVTKLSPDGKSLVYSTYLGSHGDDEGWGIAVDSAGDAFITGDTDSDQYIVSADAQQKTRGGKLDAIITVLNPSGSGLIYSAFIGGAGDDSGQAIALDQAGQAYITGYTVSANFTVTAGVAQSTPGGGAADGFLLKYAFPVTAPGIASNGIVNAASFAASAPVSPGSIVSIFGANFSNKPVNAQAVPLATSLGSVSVTFNGVAAPLFYVSPTQINAQVPFEVQPGPASVIVKGPGGSSSAGSVTVAAVGPGVFTAGTQAVVQNQDGTINSTANPAKAGTVVTVYLTGIGPVNNPVATGAAASSNPVSVVTSPVTATIGSAPAAAQFVGYTPGSVGLAQANLVVPQGVTGNVPMVITIGGTASNSTTISVSQ